MKLIATLTLLLFALSLQAEEETQDDTRWIEGKWKLIERHFDGNVTKGEHTLEFDGATVTYSLSNRENKMKYELDPTTTPKQMEWMGERDGRKRTNRLIYSLEGDTLKTCFRRPAGKRPTKFEANKGDGQVMHVYERVK